jgi:hypothetical protein
MRKQLLALFAAAAVGAASAAHASAANCGATDVPQLWPAWPAGDITTNTTWSGTIILQSPVFVKNGATLTILPGTIVRGQPRQASFVAGQTAGTPGALVVSNNGRIIADGQPTNSIIMTTAAIDNDNNGVADDLVAPIGRKDPWTPGPDGIPGTADDDKFLDDTCGTAPLAPLGRDGEQNAALWGGPIILGNAPTNLANKSVTSLGLKYGQDVVEGLSSPGYPVADATYGGGEPHDNSGVLRYVSIRHGGDEIGNSNEINGLTLAGVGDGTTISYVEAYSTFDDGFEWFGGTVNGDHLAAILVGDDSFDSDQGYTGVNQYLFTIQTFFNENDGGTWGQLSGDKMGEWDGDDSDTGTVDRTNLRINQAQTVVDSAHWPEPAANYYNLTGIGSTPDGAQDFLPVSPSATNQGPQWRHCAAGNLFNSVIVSTGAGKMIDANQALLANCAAGHNINDHITAGTINLVCSTLDDGPALGGTASPPTLEAGIVANGDALSEILRGLSPAITADDNSINPASFDLVNDDTTFNPMGDASGKLVASLKTAAINPRTVQGLGRPNAGCVPPRGTGLDSSTNIRGAFVFSQPLWTNAWTALNQAGLLAN